jgi:DNA-binding NarL/FixJ family response regulator
VRPPVRVPTIHLGCEAVDVSSSTPDAQRSSPLRVVIADDHAATRMGIRIVLENAGMVVCAEASTPDETVAAVLEHRPDIALVDVIMPPTDGIDAAERITASAPGTTVIMLTGSASQRHLIAALRAGARGYLLKDTNPERLPAAIRGVLAGESAIPRTLVPHLIDAVARGAHRRTAGTSLLSEREYEVLEALCAGLRSAEVAERLGLAEATVRRHAASAAAKLGVATRDEAIARFSRGDIPKTE